MVGEPNGSPAIGAFQLHSISSSVFFSVFFAEPVFDKRDKCGERGCRVWTLRFKMDRRAWPRGKHHEPHDRRATGALTIARYRHFGVEHFSAFDKLGRRTRMQALPVDDHDIGGMNSGSTRSASRLIFHVSPPAPLRVMILRIGPDLRR
jgi:hypothetical protein